MKNSIFFDDASTNIDYYTVHEDRKSLNKENNKVILLENLFLIDTILIDNKEYIGFIKKKNSVLINKAWDYAVDEGFPDEMYAEDKDKYGMPEGSLTKVKIHRVSNFKLGYENG